VGGEGVAPPPLLIPRIFEPVLSVRASGKGCAVFKIIVFITFSLVRIPIVLRKNIETFPITQTAVFPG
jgi:hypothetical protein